VLLNAQEPITRQNDASFFYAVARAIYVQMRSHSWGRRIKPPDIKQFESHPYSTITTWVEDEIEPLLDGQVFLITIDEFEKIGQAIAAGELTEKVLDYLRHIMQHSETMLYLFCGVETLEALGPNASSYFISAHAIEISYLAEDAATELIRNPNPDAGAVPGYDDDVVAEILRLTYRQPYLIQAICSKIIDIANEKRLEKIDMPVLAEALPTLFTTNILYFMNIWDDAGKAGQAILTALIDGPSDLADVSYDRQALHRLLQRRVVHTTADGLHEIEIPLVRRWITQQV
jgi:hypothetical protein